MTDYELDRQLKSGILELIELIECQIELESCEVSMDELRGDLHLLHRALAQMDASRIPSASSTPTSRSKPAGKV